MIYLIAKMALYLIIAVLGGGAAGALLRDFVCRQREEQMRRELADSRAKIPQLESQIRSRDESLRRLKKERDDIQEAGSTGAQEQQLLTKLRERELEVQRLKADLAEAQTAAADGLIAGDALVAATDREAAQAEVGADDEATDTIIAELHERIEQQNEALAKARIQLELAETTNDYQREAEELTQRLRQRADDQQRLQQQLDEQQQRVLQLERERELQTKSLKVLHQQLELARETASAERD
ncbi:MAG: hypothetical protein AAF648_16115 [Pseudomonadota bacterium]